MGLNFLEFALSAQLRGELLRIALKGVFIWQENPKEKPH